ncbi:hypothetical protein NM208_g176 [Fusarium decemcellulare]|uniref:Uncharacterized protein n=2 Tax=Fusarium decemcellulare TaxID=57161 RepID=A0ACC1T0T2_9HYPO|nr:hypothetical protein NM208_g4166 [Fusarium decemcellulare]KAJ3550078.1 hypothetical protein NM208_g176 [Fusarium decemcellulare]
MASLYRIASSVVCCTLVATCAASLNDYPSSQKKEATSLSIAAFPAAIAEGDVEVEFISTESPLDAPKITAVNDTTFDWWYFDALSANNQGLFLLFNLGGPNALLGGNNDAAAFASIHGIFENGTAWHETGTASTATVITSAEGSSSGIWEGTGASWTSTSDSKYIVTLNGRIVKGVITLDSIASPHYPCGPVETGSDLVIAPGVGWSNPVPDADVYVDLQVNGQAFNFRGTGYHDKNWGTQFFPSGFNTWYWGHARVGAYSIVWFSVIAPDSSTGDRFSGYVSKDGQILHAACGPDSVQVRPIGTPYPRGNDTNWASGFLIEMNLGAYGYLNVTAFNDALLVDGGPIAKRYMGRVVGTIKDKRISGSGQWEDLWLPLS